MLCPQCAAPAQAADQKFCAYCGAQFGRGEARPAMLPVADGTMPLERRARVRYAVVRHGQAHPILLAASAIAVVAAVTVAIMVVIGMVIAAVTALTPLVILITAIYLLGFRRRRRWLRL